MGDIHYHGLAVPKDDTKAAEYYRLAADARLPQAMYNLGYMHQYGYGIPKDFHLAKRYFDMVSTHHRGSMAVGYTALAWLGLQWGWELATEDAMAENLLIGGLSVALAVVLAALIRRRMM